MSSKWGRVSSPARPQRSRVLWHAVTEFFLQRSAEHACRAEGTTLARRRARELIVAAVRTLRAAEQLESGETRVLWARQAACTLIEGFAVSVSQDDGEAAAGPAASLADACILVSRLPGAGQHRSTLEQLRDPEFRPRAARREYDALVRLFAWLEGHIDVRTEREVRLSRYLRVAALSLAGVGAAAASSASENIARGKAVSASTVCGFTPAPVLGRPALDRVVDGRRRELAFAVCTQVETKPWVAVDLGEQHRVAQVVVYPRTDCCFGELELPIVVQVSSDNQRFEMVDEQVSPATTDSPWRFAIGGRSARYVRVSTDAKEPTQVVVSEIEVYE